MFKVALTLSIHLLLGPTIKMVNTFSKLCPKSGGQMPTCPSPCRGVHPPKLRMHMAYFPHFHNISKSHFSAKLTSVLLILCFFVSPILTMMHRPKCMYHGLHVGLLDASAS